MSWNRNKYDINIDLDGVLGDWGSQVCKIFGTSIDKVAFPYGTYFGINQALGVTEAEMWEVIDKHGEEFWAEIEPFPWAMRLIEMCRGYGRVGIVTSPAKHPRCASGKTMWLQKHFGDAFRSYAITAEKWRLSSPDSVLVDDYPVNCEYYVKWGHGGHAILFPAIWNEMHSFDGDRVGYVEAKIREWLAPKGPLPKALSEV